MDLLRTAIIFLTYCVLNIRANLSNDIIPSSPLSHSIVSSPHNERRAIDVDAGRRLHKFVTRPDIEAPIWNVEKNVTELQEQGYWFLAFYQGLAQDGPGSFWLGPHIYDNHGELIWGGATAFKHWNIFDFQAGSRDGQPILTMLTNHDRSAYILDDHYQVIQEVDMSVNKSAKGNMHAFHVIEDGKRALVITEYPRFTSREISAQVGFDGNCKAGWQGGTDADLVVHEFRFTEFNLDDMKPIFEWNAKYHIGLDEVTRFPKSIKDLCTDGWDILHLNAVDKFPDGDYLLSSRHTSTLYKISHIDGHIVWRLGGKKSDFKFLDDDVEFSRQHHGRVRSQDDTHIVLTLFDNSVSEAKTDKPTHDYSRGLVLSLDTSRMEAKTIIEYPHPQRNRVVARGNFQTLPNGNAFLSWAWNSRITEYTANGNLVLSAALRIPAPTYRAFKYPWVGRPITLPDVYSEAVWMQKGEEILTTIYVSWNGATEVDRWEFNKVDENGHVELIESVERTGFETKLHYEGMADYVLLEAFDKDGKSLAKSKVVRTVPATAMGVESGLSPVEVGDTRPNLPEDTRPNLAEDEDKTAQFHPMELPPDPDFDSAESSVPSLRTVVPAFLFGVCCSVILIVLGFFIYWKRKRPQESIWRVVAPKYAPVKQEEEEDYELHRPGG